MEYALGQQQDICWETPVVHNLTLFALSHSFAVIWPLLLIYLFSLSSCSKTSSVLCVLSRAARPQSSVCVFVPVSLSDHVNPLRGLAHLLPCFFFLLPPLLPSPLVCVVPPPSLRICCPTCQSAPRAHPCGPVAQEVTPH